MNRPLQQRQLMWRRVLCRSDPAVMFQDEDGVPVELRHLPEYKELMELKKLKKQKLQEIQAESALMQHVGYKVHTQNYQSVSMPVPFNIYQFLTDFCWKGNLPHPHVVTNMHGLFSCVENKRLLKRWTKYIVSCSTGERNYSKR